MWKGSLPKNQGALPSGITASFTDLGTSENAETRKTGIAPEVRVPIILTDLFVDLQKMLFFFSRRSVESLPSGGLLESICFEQPLFMIGVLMH